MVWIHDGELNAAFISTGRKLFQFGDREAGHARQQYMLAGMQAAFDRLCLPRTTAAIQGD